MSTTIDGTTGVTAPTGAIFNGIASGTAVASTSGTSIDFTSIPSWVKRITVMFDGVSTNGTSNIQVQLGAGSVEITGYVSTSTTLSTAATTSTSTTGYLLIQSNAASSTQDGLMTFVLFGSNKWKMLGGSTVSGFAQQYYCVGTKTLGGTLDRVRITTVNGTDTFDAGSINILYE